MQVTQEESTQVEKLESTEGRKIEFILEYKKTAWSMPTAYGNEQQDFCSFGATVTYFGVSF